MYHIHCKGPHYEIGFTFGSRLKKFGICILDNVPFEISQKRIQFANACIPLYEEQFPQILEEIRGISDGNKCAYEALCAVLLSMYCVMPEEVHCSCMALRNQDGVYFARNSDFLVEIEKLYMNTIYTFTDGGYAFQGNTTAFVEMEDGVNAYGLAIGLTSIYPKQIQPGLNAGMLLRLCLERCKTVDDVVRLLNKVTFAASQTFTVVDGMGNIACIECSVAHMQVYKPKEANAFVCATNCFHLSEMKNERMKGIDDWFAKERYQTMKTMLSKNVTHMTLQNSMQLMRGQEGFICQYKRAEGRDTVWSIVYDVFHKELYRVEGNPFRKQYRKDKRFKME